MVLTGFGFGMMFLPSVVGVGYYFAKKRAVATGIAVCGTGCGVMCLAPFGKMLIQVYKWQNAHLILGKELLLNESYLLLVIVSTIISSLS